MTIEKKQKFLINFAFYAVVCAIIYIAFKFLSVYLLPFVIGIIASFVVQRPVRVLNKSTKIPKSIATIVLVVLTYFAIVGGIGLIVFALYKWISALLVIIPEYFPTFSSAMNEIGTTFSNILNDLPKSTIASLSALPEKLVTSFTSGITSWLSSSAANVVKNIPGLLVSIIITVVASCYIAKDYEKVIKLASLNIPRNVWNYIVDIKTIFVKNILKMIRGYAVLMMITFAELTVGFLILRVDSFIALAAIISIVDILPVLGTGTVLIPWALIELITGNIWMATGILIIYLVITILRNFLEPKIIGAQVGMHPLLTLISMFVGLKLIGFAGIFIFPITLIIINSLYKQGKIKLFKKDN